MPGAFRLIPMDTSSNNGISFYDSHMARETLDGATHFICQFGIGCLMAKADIESVSRLLPIHPDDYLFAGVIHALDSVFFVGSPKSLEYRSNLLPFLSFSEQFGTPNKSVIPVTTLMCMGNGLMEARSPIDTVIKIRNLQANFVSRQKAPFR